MQNLNLNTLLASVPIPKNPLSADAQKLRMIDQEKIREKLNMIDDKLTGECLFCGSVLIDMVGHGIEEMRGFEFAEKGQDPEKEEAEEWIIR